MPPETASRARPGSGAREWTLRLAGWSLGVVLWCAAFLALSYLTTGVLLGTREDPPPFDQLRSAFLSALLVSWAVPRLARRSARTRAAAGASFALAAFLIWDLEAALPAAGAFVLALLWSAREMSPRLLRTLRRYPLVPGALLGLLGIELALQLVALAATGGASRPTTALDAEVRVLCVGDSFTFGVGVRGPEQAWPAVLEQRLAERLAPHSVRVWNRGVPAQNSATLTRALPAALETFRPQLTIVCFGANNDWNLRDVDLASYGVGNRAWLWRRTLLQAAQRLRLVRLVQLSRFRFGEKPDPEAEGGEFAWYWERPAAREDLAATRQRTEAEPDRAEHWSRLAQRLIEAGEYEEALMAADRGLGCADASGVLWRDRGQALGRLKRYPEAFAAFARAVELGEDAGAFHGWLLWCEFPADLTARCLDELRRTAPEVYRRIPPPAREDLGATSSDRVLRMDLDRTLQYCRERDSTLLLHTYPFFAPRIRARYATFAATHGVPLVYQYDRFQEYLRAHPDADLFVADGHCNEAGYAKMAEHLLPAVLEVLAERGLVPQEAR